MPYMQDTTEEFAAKAHSTGKLGISFEKIRRSIDRRICVAPMMDYTDRHCRFVHRLFSDRALLYTEMLVATAVIQGNRRRLLAFDASEHPLALQLGGSDPWELAQAAQIGEQAGFDEINLNVGCPSDRVQSGAFGACLMATPDVVAECVTQMQRAVQVPVTVKCRIGLGRAQDYARFVSFIDRVAQAGVTTFIVHARNAILEGLSPKQNRDIPPLNYDFVYRLKRERPHLAVVLNGGLRTVAQALEAVQQGVDGVMIGRAAIERPALLSELHRALIDGCAPLADPETLIESVIRYAQREQAQGVRLSSIARHLHGMFAGLPGARAWRRFVSECTRHETTPARVLREGLRLQRALAA